jgi:hypothetical protein
MMLPTVRLTRWKITGIGATKTCLIGSDMPAFEYKQAEEVRDALARHGVRYMFIGKSGAILLGFPDTTQDADLFVDKSPGNGAALVIALLELGFTLSEAQAEEIRRGKDFVQLKNGPFDLDLVFAPDGLERFDDAWQRRIDVEGFPVCHIDDIIAKAATNRIKDRESLPRLRSFREYWLSKHRG